MEPDIKQAIEDIGKSFEEFKAANDLRLKEIEKKGSSDPILTDKVETISKAVGDFQALKDQLEKIQKNQEKIELSQEKIKAFGAKKPEEDPAKIAYKDAFIDYMHQPKNSAKANELDLALKALATNTNSGADGGYAVPEIISRNIMQRVYDLSPMRKLATVETVGSTDYKKLINLKGATGGWASEGGTIPDTDTPTLLEVSPTFGKLYAYPSATEEVLADAFFNVESWLVNEVSDTFAEMESSAFISGDGVNKPTGFMTGPIVSTGDKTRPAGSLQYIPSGAATALNNPDVIFNLVYAIQKRYRQNSRWLMNKNSLSVVRTLKDANQNYIWTPGLANGQAQSLAGYSIEEDETMPDIAADSFPAAFGDFQQAYLIVDRVGMAITRDEVTKPGLIRWYFRRRLGGHLMEDRALKLLRISAS